MSQFLRQELHGLFESVNPSAIPELFAWIKEIGGYFKRFRGGALTPWIHHSDSLPVMDLEARSTQTFFEVLLTRLPSRCNNMLVQVDRHLSSDPIAQNSGATASLVLLHALDAPSAPFFSAERVALTVAHCG